MWLVAGSPPHTICEDLKAPKGLTYMTKGYTIMLDKREGVCMNDLEEAVAAQMDQSDRRQEEAVLKLLIVAVGAMRKEWVEVLERIIEERVRP